MDVNALIEAVIFREGGYVDNANDRGGPTNYGITEAVARSQGYSGAMRDLPRAEAVAIYLRLYWLRPRLDKVAEHAPTLAAKLLDISVNMGPISAIGFLKRALNAFNRSDTIGQMLSQVASIDDALLAALQSFLTSRGDDGEAVLVKAVNALQGAQYIAITERRPADKVFAYGWIKNRIG